MPNTIPLTAPTTVQTGNADVLLTQTDFLRNNTHILQEFFSTQGTFATFASKLRALGWAKSVAVQSPITEHYYNKRETRTFTVGSIVTAAGGAGQQIVIAIGAGDMKSVTGDDNVARKLSRPRQGEKVQFPDRNVYKIIAKDQTTNPHRLTLKPVSSTVNANTAIVAAAKAFIIAPTGAEATGQPKSVTNLYGKYQNRFTIAKETALASGTSLTTKSPLKAINGMPQYWYLKDVDDATIRHEINKSKILVFDQLGDGNVTDYSVDFDDNFPDKGTEGFLQAAETQGQIINYVDLPSYTIDQFDAVSAFYKQYMLSTQNIMVWQGWQIGARVENVLVEFLADKSFQSYVSNNFMKSALTSYQEDGYSEDDMFVAIGFRGVRKNGMNYMFSYLNELNDSESGGASGFTYGQSQYFMPFGMTKDAKSKTQLPYMQFEYRGQDSGGYSREDEVWKTGGSGPITKTDGFDVQRSFFRSEIALHVANAELIVVNRPS